MIIQTHFCALQPRMLAPQEKMENRLSKHLIQRGSCFRASLAPPAGVHSGAYVTTTMYLACARTYSICA